MTPPALADVRAWLQVPASVVSDPQLAQVLEAEMALQGQACRVLIATPPVEPPVEEPLPAALAQAIYRRVGREIAARGVPLGMLGADSEYGPARLSRWDAEVDRLEAPYRVVVFG